MERPCRRRFTEKEEGKQTERIILSVIYSVFSIVLADSGDCLMSIEEITFWPLLLAFGVLGLLEGYLFVCLKYRPEKKQHAVTGMIFVAILIILLYTLSPSYPNDAGSLFAAFSIIFAILGLLPFIWQGDKNNQDTQTNLRKPDDLNPQNQPPEGNTGDAVISELPNGAGSVTVSTRITNNGRTITSNITVHSHRNTTRRQRRRR
jgi:drug/metabolite transporter superfamily protein YnfA